MKRVIPKLLFSSVGIIISLSCVEVYLRLFAPQAIYAIRYCYLGWCHVPGAVFVHGGETGEFVTNVQYNSHGLRDHEYNIDKPPGSRRILIFGDYYAEGLEVEMENLLAKRLERLFHNCIPDQAVQVINFGVSAYDTAQEWWYFKNEGVQYQPDLVVVIWTGESGSPFVEMKDGRIGFVEPRYSQGQIWARKVKNFFKLQFHTVSFLFDRLRSNQSVREFQQKIIGSPIGNYQLSAYGDSSAFLPFSSNWKIQLAIFKEFLRTSQAHGAGLIVAAIHGNGYRYLTKSLKQYPDLGLMSVNLQQVSDEDEKQYHYPRDGHWTSEGHKKAARIIFRYILRKNILGSSENHLSKNSSLPQCLTS